MQIHLTKDKFGQLFAEMNASWSFEDAALSEEEKGLLYKRINHEITDEEYTKLFEMLNTGQGS